MKQLLDDELFSNDKKDYKFYRNFMNVKEAKTFSELLDDNDIPYLLETSGTVIDSAIVGDGLIPKAIIKILGKDFIRVEKVIANELKKVSYEELGDHYLTQLDNDELLGIFNKPDEWTQEDVEIAKIILKYRGVKVSEEEIQSRREDRISIIREGKEGSMTWICLYSLGIIFGLFISPIFLIAGLGMSYYYAYGKSTDLEGNSYFVYEEQTRQKGVVMLYGGITLIFFEFIALHYFL